MYFEDNILSPSPWRNSFHSGKQENLEKGSNLIPFG
jgi:hypothetical protein